MSLNLNFQSLAKHETTFFIKVKIVQTVERDETITGFTLWPRSSVFPVQMIEIPFIRSAMIHVAQGYQPFQIWLMCCVFFCVVVFFHLSCFLFCHVLFICRCVFSFVVFCTSGPPLVVISYPPGLDHQSKPNIDDWLNLYLLMYEYCRQNAVNTHSNSSKLTLTVPGTESGMFILHEPALLSGC